MPAHSIIQQKRQPDGFAPRFILRRNLSDAASFKLRENNLDLHLQRQREQIARDLHDGIGSQLTHIISRLDVLAYRHQGLEDQLTALRNFATEAVEQLRETIYVLQHTRLTFHQLAERMRGLVVRLAYDIESPELSFSASGGDGLILPPRLALSVFRIMQEAVNNAVKHAEAQHISVILSVSARMLTLFVCDDGKGFDPKHGSAGYGVINMERRSVELDGRLFIRSSHTGTEVVAELPL